MNLLKIIEVDLISFSWKSRNKSEIILPKSFIPSNLYPSSLQEIIITGFIDFAFLIAFIIPIPFAKST